MEYNKFKSGGIISTKEYINDGNRLSSAAPLQYQPT